MKKILAFLSLTVVLSLSFSSVNAAQEDDLGFLSDIFSNIDLTEGTTPAEQPTPVDPWAEPDNINQPNPVIDELDSIDLNSAKEEYTPWGQLVVDKKLESDIVTNEPETPTTQSASEVEVLPQTGPTEIILLLVSLMIAGTLFYRRRKSIS